MSFWERNIWAKMGDSWPRRRSGRRGFWAERKARYWSGSYPTCLLSEDVLEEWATFMEHLMCSWLIWSWRDAIKGLKWTPLEKHNQDTQWRVQTTVNALWTPEAEVNGAHIKKAGIPCWMFSFPDISLFFILKVHVTLQAVGLTNINEVHFAAAMTFSKSRETKLLFLYTVV